ncbi:MAG: hypothetical protein M3P49_06690 [Actinomycetota bacterium]|nr:hypothetical protein [Actinomycetota bacterium]
MSEEKIKPPASWQAGRDQEAGRRTLVNEWRRHLTAKQRDRLETEGAGAVFKTAIPLEALQAFTPEERDELLAHEQREYGRFRPLAEAKSTQRAAWIAAGGEGETFDAAWSDGFGREETIAAIAAGQDLGPGPDRFTSPY